MEQKKPKNFNIYRHLLGLPFLLMGLAIINVAYLISKIGDITSNLFAIFATCFVNVGGAIAGDADMLPLPSLFGPTDE